jgi:hypothetical protein
MLPNETHSRFNRRRIVALTLLGFTLGYVAVALLVASPEQNDAPFVPAAQSAMPPHQRASPKEAKDIATTVAPSSGNAADPRAGTPDQSGVTMPTPNDQPATSRWRFKWAGHG